MTETQPLLKPPVLSDDEPLAKLWDDPVSRLATLDPWKFEPPEIERHEIYSLLLMSLVEHFWNGNKRGLEGEYPWREKQRWPNVNGLYRANGRPARPGDREPACHDYLGHNIACLAVDGDGDIIDFEFNHNEIFASSVEHAESRLIRRLFSLTGAGMGDGWNLADREDLTPQRYSTLLSNVTVYTSLESCAQCAGIMQLARVKDVVYLQKDFGMFCIGNILFNLNKRSEKKHPKPRPIPACDFGFAPYNQLNEEYANFFHAVEKKPFWRNGNSTLADKGVTAFLCTDVAYKIFAAAAERFENMQPEHVSEEVPEPYQQTSRKPSSANGAAGAEKKPKTNRDVFRKAKEFLDDAKRCGHRGTPHQL